MSLNAAINSVVVEMIYHTSCTCTVYVCFHRVHWTFPEATIVHVGLHVHSQILFLHKHLIAHGAPVDVVFQQMSDQHVFGETRL